MKRHKRNSHYASDKDITLKSFTLKSDDEDNEESHHECVFSNPTYQDLHDRTDDNELLVKSEK